MHEADAAAPRRLRGLRKLANRLKDLDDRAVVCPHLALLLLEGKMALTSSNIN
ncbi:MAG: hypothetical protein WD775_13010 [Burkholderiales bacterium]